MNASVTPLHNDPSQQIQNLMAQFSIETTPGQADKLQKFSDYLETGSTVAVTFLPGSDYLDTIKTAKRLRDEGFHPAPHIAARSLKSQAQLEDFVSRAVGEAGVDHVVVLAGAVDKPHGPYESSMEILESGILDRHNIRTIGVAGHPEGSPDINDEMLKQALSMKNDFALRTDCQMYLATQFVFEAAPIIAWDRAIQAEGNRLPIHIGVPGLATIKTLLAHARACGIGASMRFLTKQAMNVAKLMSVSAPDRLITDLAAYKATDPNCGISHVHMYPLGGVKRSAFWAQAAASGRIKMRANNQGFELIDPLP